MTVYIGLDTATVMGLALWFPDKNLALVKEFKGDPIIQMNCFSHILLHYLRDVRTKDIQIAMEEQYNFLNAKTVRSLLQRYGYIKYSILNEFGYVVDEWNPKTGRKLLGVKTKAEAKAKLEAKFTGVNLTDNHSDALAMALISYVWSGNEFDYDSLVIKPLEGTL